MIRDFEALLEAARSGPLRRVAVAGADSQEVLRALDQAVEAGLAEPLLIGDPTAIRGAAAEVGGRAPDFEVVSEGGGEAAVAAAAVQRVRDGQAQVLMKGTVSTAPLLHALLAARELRKGRLCHVAAVEVAGYGRLQLHTDGGINLAPDLETRRDMLRCAVELARKLDVAHPKVAGLALVEKLNPELPETEHMATLAAWVAEGHLGPATMEGPIALDVALSATAAERKGIESRIAGEVDVFLGPDATTVNFLVKGLVALAGAKASGIVLGSKVPVVLLSRADDPATRLRSLALAAVAEG